jgi:hypothetical protein
MLITLKNVLPELQNSVPAFVMNPEWLEIEGTYLIFGDFARFICSEAEFCNMSVPRKKHPD